MSLPLVGRRVLVVEDDYFIVEEMVRSLRESGASIVGPVSNVGDALDKISETDALDAAVLDINLQGEMAFPVADALMARGIPFLFATGYGTEAIPAKYKAVVCCLKPVDPQKVGKALFG